MPTKITSEGMMLKLHPKILMKNGKKEFVILTYEEFVALQERLSDAEDLMVLRKAKRAEQKKKSIPLSDVKRELGI
jgi:PHD/YefM family antitoxin component YafN of YafNO toxin-antitoxin module